MGATAEKIRVQFDFSPEAYDELNEIQKEADASTKTETVRYGLRTLQWLLSEIKAGRRILVEDDKDIRQVIFPFLPGNGRSSSKK
jgi:hypothetical protein